MVIVTPGRHSHDMVKPSMPASFTPASHPPPSVFTHPTLPGLRYYDQFITATEEASLLTAIRSHPHAWKTLRNRSLQNWGGLPHHRGMLPTPIPPFLNPLLLSLRHSHVFPYSPNHVLVNRYFPGQGIHPHVDGPTYRPAAAILSLASPILMRFSKPSFHLSQPPIHQIHQSDASQHSNGPHQLVAQVLLRPRSLLVMEQDLYHHFFHAIEETSHDLIDHTVVNRIHEPLNVSIPRQERISLTVRAVCKVINNPLVSRLVKQTPKP